MKIIISPAKKMKVANAPRILSAPSFKEDALVMSNFLKTLSVDEIAKSFKIKGKLLSETMELISNFNIDNPGYPALLTYDGIQYKYLDARTLTSGQLDFLNEKLVILSGLYGVLKPFDAINFYRLEMQAEFKGKEISSVYNFWANKIHMKVYQDENVILNLASLEYSKTLKTYLRDNQKLIDVFFYDLEGGKLVEKGVYAKMMRGLMVRYIAINMIDDIESLKDFHEFSFKFSKENSTGEKLVYIRQKEI